VTATQTAPPDLDLFAGLGEELAGEAVAWLHDPARTAHRLVTVPTAVLVARALGYVPVAPRAERPPVALPAGLWRVLPARLLSLHSRRGDALERLRISPAGHLALTATVLERWGWARTGERVRTWGGRRCIRGAQSVVLALGYGTGHTLAEAGRRLDGALAVRGIRLPYPQWNELGHVTARDALALVWEAAAH